MVHIAVLKFEMTPDKIWQRSDILNTQVITRDTGKRLGVVSQLWVDVDQREVIALGLKENLLSGVMGGEPKFMLLSSIRQIGDVVLVESDDAIEDIDVNGFSNLINSEVITETGEPLGRVRGFRFNVEDGKVATLVISSLGIPQIPDKVVSTYELAIEEIVSTGRDRDSGRERLIVFEGAEERLNQLTVGLLESVGIGKPPWERDEDEDYVIPTTPAANQLGTGVRTSPYPPVRTAKPQIQETWEDDDWEEQPAVRRPTARRRAAPLPPEPAPTYYQEEENWSEASEPQYVEDYEDEEYEEDYEEEEEYEELEEDVWADKQPAPYQAPRLSIPEKVKAPEYEEEY